MACNLSSSVSLDCRSNLGGVSSVFIGSTTGSDIVLLGESAGSITGFQFGTGATEVDSVADLTIAPMYEFQQPRQAANLTEAGTFDEANGVAFYETSLTIVINKLQASNLEALDILGQNTKLAVVVKDNNGSYFLVGNETGAIVSASTSDTGTAFGDRNGITITFLGYSTSPLLVLDIV
jgi:hypothetical protein